MKGIEAPSARVSGRHTVAPFARLGLGSWLMPQSQAWTSPRSGTRFGILRCPGHYRQSRLTSIASKISSNPAFRAIQQNAYRVIHQLVRSRTRKAAEQGHEDAVREVNRRDYRDP